MTRRRSKPLFRDRADAGRQLARALEPYSAKQPVLLALPRGGVAVAREVARALRAPLDVLVVRKIGAPYQPELAIGAIAEDTIVLNEAILKQLGLSRPDLDHAIGEATLELKRRADSYRGSNPALALGGKTAIIIDDGLATGATAAVAIDSAKSREPHRIVLAVPVGAADAVKSLRQRADAVVCLHTPADFQAVGRWYRDFRQVADDEVLTMLQDAARAARA